ncbi:hypothetical protein BU23DRAFT_567696 [Bimuria novae-zelandiae CBS 107.79]|uniref:Integrase core domain-containing protein n=1 Tax=Bimuria novae-zelandiae CBS 107.79 TaxID=1447943 RepID=A0A6A5VL90_9PLEO|nr:hypothetical protein BU23DRAFT_567696 [Bimuria novae-zelandiae CBS 107.79]
MLADAHYQLQSLYQPDLEFQECYLYGTSTANQRIEAWWDQLSKGIIFRWRNYFASLRTQGHFSKDNLADQISLYAVYILILREELYNFVRLWNSHSIRKQANRQNAVVGKPFMLYHYPGSHVQNWGIPFNSEQLRTIKEGVGEWEIDAYLPSETLSWCKVGARNWQI